MGRRWIMIELGDHCATHIVPRLIKVIDGDDVGGITEAVEWKGGGGFRYYRLAPSLLKKDAWDNWVISKDYDPPKVAQAVCKLMGFVYQPERNPLLDAGPFLRDRLYLCHHAKPHAGAAGSDFRRSWGRAHAACVLQGVPREPDAFPNLTIRKIPQAVLRKCEWGKDDYSLNVANLPEAPREPDEPEPAPKSGKKGGNGKAASQNDLFSKGGGK